MRELSNPKNVTNLNFVGVYRVQQHGTHSEKNKKKIHLDIAETVTLY